MPERSARDEAKDDMAALRAEVEALRRQLAEMAETLGKLSAHEAEGLAETLKRRFAELGEGAGETLREKAEPFGKAAGQAADYARAEPLKALGLAMGAGMILGLLMGRR